MGIEMGMGNLFPSPMELGVDLQHCRLQLGPSVPPQHSLEAAGAAEGWLVPSPGATSSACQ